MPLADKLDELIDELLSVHNTSESNDKLITALRAIQSAAARKPPAVAPGADPLDQLPAFLKTLDLKTQQDIASVLGADIPHLGKYEIDPRWAESLINYYKFLDRRVPILTPSDILPETPVQVLKDEPEICIALVGDWGVDPDYPVGKKVLTSISARKPHYIVHLGDTYYSGLPSEEEENVLSLWPKDTISFALNSNHEMYAGGTGYFGSLLCDPRFASQKKLSYFALYNSNWLIVGLDTAYHGRHNSQLYQKGFLADARDKNGTVQREWLIQLLNDPQHLNKRVIILTHHDGFDIAAGNGRVTVNELWSEITGCHRKDLWTKITGWLHGNAAANTTTGALSGGRDWWWYWGHVHTPVVFQRIIFGDGSAVRPRCVGHGAIPYLPFPQDYTRLGDGTMRIVWAETEPANANDETDPERALNGYALLTLKGSSITEEFYDENGKVRWRGEA